MFLLHYLQSFSPFACLFVVVVVVVECVLLIWHHERGLGLFTGITDSGASVCMFFVFLNLLFVHIMASVASLYKCIALTASFCRTALGRSTKLQFFPCIIFPFPGFVCVWLFGCLSLDASFFFVFFYYYFFFL